MFFLINNKIDFAVGYPKEGDVLSGMRHSCDTYIELDLAKAMKDGIPFFISKNNVILTKGIEGRLPRVLYELRKKDRNTSSECF